MPFADLTLPEREIFLKEATGCHIPGYTGHCPTLKFRFGKRYGASTKEAIEELKQVSPVTFLRPYKSEEPWSKAFKETVREKDEEIDPIIYTNLPRRPFIPGYTGYIPGLNFEYGMSFNSAANKSVNNFTKRIYEEQTKRYNDKALFESTMPKMCCVRSKDEVSRLFEKNARTFYKNYVPPITAELPPIAGYTGHIPGLKGNEHSLSQRFYSAAKTGLAMLREERMRRHHVDKAKEAVKNALVYSRAT